MKHTFFNPTKLVFGDDALNTLKHIAQQYKNIFIMSTKNGLTPETEQTIREYLGDSLESFVIGPLHGEPTQEDINALIKQKTAKTDCIIGIGGGSYLDGSKALAIQEADIGNFSENSVVLPIITIPTTAGTGAELTKSSIVKMGDIKQGLRSEKLFPQYALVDPQLCNSMNEETTLYTGFDIFTHSVETHTSNLSTPITRMFSAESLKIVMEYLPRAMQEFSTEGRPSKETRAQLSYASAMQGYTLSNASTCLPHRLQYALSTKTDASHPKALAAIYRSWLRFEQPVINGVTCDEMIAFMDSLPLVKGLEDIGIVKGDVPYLVSRVEGDLSADPKYSDKKQLEDIFLGAFS